MKLIHLLFENIETLSQNIKNRYDVKTLQLYEYKDDIILGLLVVGKNNQGFGIGTKIMIEICKYADENKKRILLTPAIKDKHHGTTSQSRLIEFYKRFGFVLNKGRNKDFTISELMYRNPK